MYFSETSLNRLIRPLIPGVGGVLWERRVLGTERAKAAMWLVVERDKWRKDGSFSVGLVRDSLI